MIAVDSNILIAAHRAEHPLHRVALERLSGIAEGRRPWGLPAFCVAEFLRVTTHPKIFTPPTPLHTGLEFIDALLASPTVRMLGPGKRYWQHFRATCEAGDAKGNLVFDVQIAAVCLEYGATRLLTADRDFARFPGLEPEYLPVGP